MVSGISPDGADILFRIAVRSEGNAEKIQARAGIASKNKQNSGGFGLIISTFK